MVHIFSLPPVWDPHSPAGAATSAAQEAATAAAGTAEL